MKKILLNTKIIILVITAIGIISCADDDDNGNIIDNTPSNTILDIIISNPDYSSFLAALSQTGVNATVAGNGNFTVFAPNNAAFDALLGGTSLEDIDNAVLTQLVLNHIINTELFAADLTTGYQKTLAIEDASNATIDMYIDTTNGVVINNQSSVIATDTDADNGVLHEVDTVINVPTIATFAVIDPRLDSLEAALTDEGNTTFTDILSDATLDFTVFAPTNDAFTTFLDGATLDDIDNDVLDQVLSNHVLPETVAVSSALTNSYVNTAAIFNGDTNAPITMYVNTDNGVQLNGASSVTQADIVTSNGVIHVVDTVVPLPDVTTFIFADPNFSSLLEAILADPNVDYITALQAPIGDGATPFTGFAPTNDAFANLFTDLNVTDISEIPLMDLSTIVELHNIVNMNIRAEELTAMDGMSFTTFSGLDITIDATTPAIIGPDGESSLLLMTDLQTTNGVVHTIDRVLRN
ncbi:fasciclin domain-containing protein [uncultured Dokdonia sp.]|uniref:fasciclin domain-containing protein n=1 Tax=uncultured Dokdonia sp. TaxID=575653 RepID=UPI00262FD60B|nr:fasciclin domain-containing protein [uncultured Dokdonia sp.]